MPSLEELLVHKSAGKHIRLENSQSRRVKAHLAGSRPLIWHQQRVEKSASFLPPSSLFLGEGNLFTESLQEGTFRKGVALWEDTFCDHMRFECVLRKDACFMEQPPRPYHNLAIVALARRATDQTHKSVGGATDVVPILARCRTNNFCFFALSLSPSLCLSRRSSLFVWTLSAFSCVRAQGVSGQCLGMAKWGYFLFCVGF